MVVSWFRFPDIIFEGFNVIYTFYVIRYNVPNFRSHMAWRIG